MTTEQQLLRLAAIIDSDKARANADGYTRPVGYTDPIGSNKTAKMSATDALLTATILGADKAEVQLDVDPADVVRGGGSASKSYTRPIGYTYAAPIGDMNVTTIGASLEKVRNGKWWLAIKAWFKEKPYRYGLFAILLAAIGYIAYKSKKG